MDPRNNLDISWSSLWRLLIIVLIAAALYWSVNILIAVFVAIIISSALNPSVSYLEKIRIPRVLGAILVFLGIILVVAIVGYAIITVALTEINKFLEQFFPLLQQWFNLDIHKFSNIYDLTLEKVYNFLPGGNNGGFFDFSRSILGSAALIISVFAMSFYLTVDHHGVERFLRAILPETQESRVTEIFLRARRKMGYWFQAQILLSFFVAVLVFTGLWLLEVPHSLILGILAGILEIVPFAGPVFVGTLATIFALSTSFSLGVYTLILFVVVQQIENHILIPLFMNRAVGLHPVAVLISLLLGANLFGIVGILIAVPATVILQEFMDDWTAKKAKRQQRLV